MPSALCPALHRFKGEAAIIGQLLTGYTAIEYQLCMCVGMGRNDVQKAITELFSKRGETKRVTLANTLGRDAYVKFGLGNDFDAAIENAFLCVKIRNQYAHCIWHDDLTGRLAFANMEEIAIPIGLRANLGNLTFLYLDMSLLHEQENFFVFVLKSFNYLNYKRRQLEGSINSNLNIQIPRVVLRPRMYLEC